MLQKAFPGSQGGERERGRVKGHSEVIHKWVGFCSCRMQAENLGKDEPTIWGSVIAGVQSSRRLGHPTFHSRSRNGLAGVVAQASPNLELFFFGGSLRPGLGYSNREIVQVGRWIQRSMRVSCVFSQKSIC